MSDLGMFNTALEHREIEVVFYQWDGTKSGAMAATAALQRELPIRGASLTSAHHHAERAIEGDGPDMNRLEVEIIRHADGQGWEGSVNRGQFLVMWLHDSRLHHVEIMDAEHGELILRPLAPVIRLRPRGSEIEE